MKFILFLIIIWGLTTAKADDNFEPPFYPGIFDESNAIEMGVDMSEKRIKWESK